MSFKYETHSHTSETSRCSRLHGAELVRYYKSLGYTGIFVTDHFFNGNTTVPHDLPWEERVNLFVKGYEAAAEEGNKIGIDVFFGWEYSFRSSDHLTYGLDAEWLYAHPDVLSWTPNEYYDHVHEAGAFVVAAHPFRQAGYIPNISLFPDKSDAVEVCNSSMTDIVNERGEWYADSYGLLKTYGSDTHASNREFLAGVESEKKFESVSDYIEGLKNGTLNFFKLYPGK